MGGLALSKEGEADDGCPGGLCSPEANDAHVQAGTFADASTGLLVAGGVLAAGGALMMILSPQVTGSGDEGPDAAPAPVSALANPLMLSDG